MMEDQVSQATFLDRYISEDEFLRALVERGLKPPSKRTLRAWRDRGILPFKKIGKNLILIPRDYDPADRKRRT